MPLVTVTLPSVCETFVTTAPEPDVELSNAVNCALVAYVVVITLPDASWVALVAFVALVALVAVVAVVALSARVALFTVTAPVELTVISPPDFTPPNADDVAAFNTYADGIVGLSAKSLYEPDVATVASPEIFDAAIAALAEISAFVIVPSAIFADVTAPDANAVASTAPAANLADVTASSAIIPDAICPVVILPDELVITALFAAAEPCAVATLAFAAVCAASALSSTAPNADVVAYPDSADVFALVAKAVATAFSDGYAVSVALDAARTDVTLFLVSSAVIPLVAETVEPDAETLVTTFPVPLVDPDMLDNLEPTSVFVAYVDVITFPDASCVALVALAAVVALSALVALFTVTAPLVATVISPPDFTPPNVLAVATGKV